MTLTLPSTPPSPQDPIFGFPRLPFPSFRPNQWEAIAEAYEAFQSHDNVILQAPTGSGKSGIAEAIRRLLRCNGVYTCTTKALQDQYLASFPHAKVIKGRSNYLTQAGKLDHLGNPNRNIPFSAITCEDCTYNPEHGCNWCNTYSLCPYVLAKKRAQTSDLAVANVHFLLNDLRQGGNSIFYDRGLVVIDEADHIEDILLSTIELNLSPQRRRKLGIDVPRFKTKPDSWAEWVEHEAMPKVSTYIDGIVHGLDGVDPVLSPTQAKEIKSLGQLYDRLSILRHGLPRGKWVYDGYSKEGEDASDDDVIFRPVYVGHYGRKMLFDPIGRCLTMSATILSPDMFADDTGMGKDFKFIDVPSTFPPEHSPIYVVPVANVVFKEKREAWPRLVSAVRGIMDRHPNERILVHTVSYALAAYIKDSLKRDPSPPTANSRRPIITYTESRGKEDALRQYKAHPAAVMLAASMDRGIDLPGDLCTVQVVAKVPFPNTSDKRIAARMYGQNGRAWYAAQAVRVIVQMSGRGVRSAEDKCVTYILDRQFPTNLWSSNKHLFPKHWVQRLKWNMGSSQIMK